MLKRIKIKGFRSFSQDSFQEVVFSQLSVLVGENNAGKSNILKAIAFALNPDESKIQRDDFSTRRSKSRSKKKGLSDKKARRIEILMYFDSPDILPQKYHKKVHKREFELKMIASGSRSEKFIKQYYLDGKEVCKMFFNSKENKAETLQELLKNFSFYHTPTIRDIDYLEIFKEMLPLEGRSDIRKAIADFGEVISKKIKPKLSAMRKQLGIKGVEFQPKINLEKLLYETRFDFVVDEGYHVPLKNVGQGYISRSIIEMALRSRMHNFIAIEEPELHMHPNAIIDLLANIKKQGKQVLITSHSPVITNYVSPKEIIVIKKVNRYSRIYQLENLFRNEFDDYSNIERQIFLNRQKTELLFARGIIFVEGQYDRIAFSKVCEKATIDLSREGILIVDTGSDYFMPYLMLAVTLNLKWVTIADRSAVFDEGNTDTHIGTYLKGLQKCNFITDEDGKNLVDSIINNYVNYDNALQVINEKLKTKNGKTIFLRGNDLSEELNSVVDAMTYGDVKYLFQRYKGSRYDKNKERVRNICKRKIKNKDWDMIIAFETINNKYLKPFAEILSEAKKFLLTK